MDLGPRGFDSKPLTLVVGPEATELYVPKTILLQIPYFQEKIPANIPADYRLKVTDTDPATAADVFYYMWTKHVPQIEIPDPEEDERWAAAGTAATKYTEAYVTARSWGLQWLEEAIIQSLLPYRRESTTNPSDIMILYNAGIQESLLYKFMIAEFGWDFQYSGFESLTKAFPNFEDIIKTMPSTLILEWLRFPEISLNCETCKDCQECEDHKRSKQPSRQDRWIGNKAKQQDGIAIDAREVKTA